MHFMVRAINRSTVFRYSDTGTNWCLGSFASGICDPPRDVVLAGQVLDCLGLRSQTILGPVWCISRDDLSPFNVIHVCYAICKGGYPASTFDLTAKVTRAVCREAGYETAAQVELVNGELNRMFLANAQREQKR